MTYFRTPSPFIYNGTHFRSRLEARWACYLGALKIDYDYEPTAFTLANGTIYIPDFHLPEFDIYLEVKPENPIIRTTERHKADSLAENLETGRVWLSHGPPPWFEQLKTSNIPHLPKALLTHDAVQRHDTPAIWVTDARFITLNKSRDTADDLTPPERLPALLPGQTAVPAHPLASETLRTALDMSRNLKLSDWFEPVMPPDFGRSRHRYEAASV